MSFRPASQAALAPGDSFGKVAANVAAARLLRSLQEQGRPATAGEQQVLARWSGWGAVPEVFDPANTRHATARAELRELLGERGWREAARTTLNAHYTDHALAAGMWQALLDAGLGADGRPVRVLEPGCGAGVFLGIASSVLPAGSQLTGVELDGMTAAIAAALYPTVEVRAESFADTPLPAGSQDLVIGNVPFGKVVLHDPVHNRGRHSLHNHFIIKSLELTRPGGLVLVVTSHWTLDAADPAARHEIAARGDLLAAVRLPGAVHQQAAGTRVVSDVLLLRRRPAGAPAGEPTGWERTSELLPLPGFDDDGRPAAGAEFTQPRERRPVQVNELFLSHPGRVLGTMGVRRGQFGPEVEVIAPREVTARFHTGGRTVAASLGPVLAEQLTAQIVASGQPLLAPRPRSLPPTVAMAARPAAAPEHPEQHLAVATDPSTGRPTGGFTVAINRLLMEHPVPASQQAELRALLGLRDTTVRLLDAEAATVEDTGVVEQLRAQLNIQYDAYVRRYGPINRVSLRRTGHVDEITGEDKLARVSPKQGGFRIDPHSPAVYALEVFDAASGTAAKAPIFTGRVIAPRAPRVGADTAADALAICLDTHGHVDLPAIATLLDLSEPDALAALGGLVFADPERDGRLVPAAEYLSGNVRSKLTAADAADAADAAEAAHARERDIGDRDTGGDGRWAGNVAALRAVLPLDLSPEEIDVRLGAAWIDGPTVQQFLIDLLADPSVIVEHPGGSTWAVRGNRRTVLATSTYGTDRADAIGLAADLLEQKPVKVTDVLEDGRRVPNLTETVAAQEKAALIGEQFADWIWSDPTRATALARRYNDLFNSFVLRSYDDPTTTAGMTLPGLTVGFIPRPHQRAAVARIVAEPAVLLGHEVGAGKTAEMVIGAMELRRLGLVRKPAVVVPNHMLEQFTREWMQLYPQARLLAASIDDLAAGRRRLLVARIATGDWDAVLLSRSAFERLPLSPGAQRAYLDGQLEGFRAQLANSKAGHGLSVKRLEGALLRAEERLKALTDGAKDPGIRFEQTGIDYLMVDEAHGYKNLRTISNIPGVGVDGSQRASDLDMKIAYLRGRHGSRIATFATATPIANSVAEAFTMQRYLRPDLLDAAGVGDFDSWAGAFGEVTTDLELSPDGTRFRMQSRFAKFRNVPELLRMWHVSADIKTGEDLHLPTPTVAGGSAENVVVAGNAELAMFMGELSARADRISSRQVPPEEDNMLKVATHGRMAALDLRLLGRDPGEDPKLITAANRIAHIHHANAGNAYPDAPNPQVRGGLQLVFCDLGTPQARPRPGSLAEGWNAYDELKTLLVARGVSSGQIAFVHSARNDREKGELFAAARSGGVSVLIGSTEKMGVGTNVQARAIALHHLDCPWRPADITQRDGRVLRQGNLNEQVQLIRYVTEGSFDAYLWQTVERKAKFIGQVMRGRLDVREIEDIGDTALSYAEVKALASGDPRILDKARADTDTTRLERLERAHHRSQRALAGTIRQAHLDLPVIAAQRKLIAAAIAVRTPTAGERFVMRVGGRRLTDRADAAVALRGTLAALPPAAAYAPGGTGPPTTVGQLAGFGLVATPQRLLTPHITLELTGVPAMPVNVEPGELAAERPLGLILRLENRAAGLEAADTKLADRAERLVAELERATASADQPFPHAAALTAARARSDQLAAELTQPDPAAHAPAGTSGPASPVAADDHWREVAARVDQRIVTDPSWPALAAALQAISDRGGDVPALMAAVVTARPLPESSPAHSLRIRLADIAPEPGQRERAAANAGRGAHTTAFQHHPNDAPPPRLGPDIARRPV